MKTTDNQLSVFLVDDDPLFLTVLNHKLHEKFKSLVRIHSYSKAEECLQHIDEKPDLVLLDYSFDGQTPDTMNGLEALRKIKATSPDIDVVMLSGHKEPGIVHESFQNGATHYIQKSQKAFLTVQHLVNSRIHENLERRDAKENTSLNILSFCIAVLLFGILIFALIKYS